MGGIGDVENSSKPFCFACRAQLHPLVVKKRKKEKETCVVCVFQIIYGKSTFTFIPYKSNRLVFVERTVAGPLFIQQLKLQTVMYNHLKMSYSFGKADS